LTDSTHISPRRLTATPIIRLLVLAMAMAYILLYLFLALLRISYPYELEWVEGAMVEHVQRVLAGQPLYVAPGVDWVAAIYPPLYYYLSAAVAGISGIGFLPLRLVSLLSSLGCFALLYAFVRKETGRASAGVIAAGLFAATYALSGSWFDLARVDSLQLLLLLAGFYLLRFGQRRSTFVLAALFTALAIFTKQTAAIAALGLAAGAIYLHRKRSLEFIVPLLICCILPLLIVNLQSGGWFYYYLFEVPAGHDLINENFAGFWLSDILRPFAIAFLLAIVYFFVDKGAARHRGFNMFAALGFVLAAWAPRVKDGNWANDLIPAYAILALLAGMAAVRINEKLEIENEKGLAAIWVAMLLVVQFGLLLYSPAKQLPTEADRAAGDALIRGIRSFPGEVWVGSHGYYSALAGKSPHATSLALYDVLRAKNNYAGKLLLDDIERALHTRRFDAIIVDNDRFVRLAEYSEYTRKAGIFPDPAVFWPVSGARTRPLGVYVPTTPHP
jgi:4-amino-4-deoxy-L-arabinose transferase-like glycosyltransferase